MDIRAVRLVSLNDNLNIVSKGFYDFNGKEISLIPSTSKIIKEDEKLNKSMSNNTQIEIMNTTTIGAVLSEDSKCCVLNFASYKTPGGGVLEGYCSQEESLCYVSNLYDELYKFKYTFYERHKMIGMNKGLYSNEAIYSEDINIIKDEEFNLRELRIMNVITMAAPYAKIIRKYNPDMIDLIYPALRDRCKRVLEIAIGYGQETLVLGAFGCGVFQNNLDDLIEIWYDLLTGEFSNKFKKIIFAVPGEISYTKFKNKFK